MTIPDVWLPIRVGPHVRLVNFRWVQAIEPLPGGRTRLQFARRHLDVDEHAYNLGLVLALRLEEAG